MNQKLHILAIDDSQSILELIRTTLVEAGHDCTKALGPLNAREALKKLTPDLILLDVEMPDMSGIEFCREIRSKPRLANIPVLFVSSVAREEIILDGFAAGGTDYIIKPFHPRELIARVEAHGMRARFEHELLAKTAELEAFSRHLEEEVRERTRDLAASQALAIDTLARLSQTESAQDELVRVRKLESLGSLVADIAHEINTPLGNCLTLATFMKTQLQNLFVETGGQIERLDNYRSENSSCLELLIKNLSRISDLIQRFRTVVGTNLGDSWSHFELEILLRESLTRQHAKLEGVRTEVQVDNPLGLEAAGYPATLSLILENLVRNSSEHAFETKPENGPLIRMEATVGEQQIAIRYSDNGCGIPADLRDKICEPFFSTKRFKGNTGLGLFIIQNQINGRLHGRLDLDAGSGTGFSCVIHCPRLMPKPEP
jgi:DNA-binding response OmpR family regulator/two-component sensor histidine kinase